LPAIAASVAAISAGVGVGAPRTLRVGVQAASYFIFDICSAMAGIALALPPRLLILLLPFLSAERESLHALGDIAGLVEAYSGEAAAAS